MRDFDCNLKSL